MEGEEPVRIKLPFGDPPPLQANHRYRHWSEKAALTKRVRHDVAWLVRSAGVKRSHSVTVGLEWVPRVKRRRDGAENLGPLLKACVDGVVDSGVVDSDEQGRVNRTMPVILPVDKDNAGVWLVIDTGGEA